MDILRYQCINHSSASIHKEVQNKNGFQPKGAKTNLGVDAVGATLCPK